MFIILVFFQIPVLIWASPCFAGFEPPCKACSLNFYSKTTIVLDSQFPPITDCEPKFENTSILNRSIIITSVDECPECEQCDKFHKIYKSITQAFFEESKEINPHYESTLCIRLHGSQTHFIMQADLDQLGFSLGLPQFFRRMNTIIDIAPLLCSELDVPGCFGAGARANIAIKTARLEVYIAKQFSLRNINFDATDAHVLTNISCKNSELTPCCGPSELGKSFLDAQMCGLKKRELAFTEIGLLQGFSLFNLEMIIESAFPPNFLIENVDFYSFNLINDDGFTSLFKVKNFPGNLQIKQVNIKNSFLLNGVLRFDSNIVENDVLYKGTSFSATNNYSELEKSSVLIDTLLISSYNEYDLNNTGEGCPALFELTEFQGIFVCKSLLVKDLRSNHHEQTLFQVSKLRLVKFDTTSLINIRETSILVADIIEESIIINVAALINCSFSNKAAFLISNSFINITEIKVLIAFSPSPLYNSLIGSINCILHVYNATLNLISGYDNVFENSEINYINGTFLEIVYEYSLFKAINSKTTFKHLILKNLKGELFPFDFNGGSSYFISCVGESIIGQAVMNANTVDVHYLEDCIFSEISNTASFWTSGRTFKNWTVYKTIFRNSSFTNFLSYYTSGDYLSSLNFIEILLENINATFFVIEVCCTTLTLKNSLFRRVTLDDYYGKSILEFDDGYFHLIDTVFDDSGFKRFPLENKSLWASLYRILIAVWWGELTLDGLSVILSPQVSAPGGIITSTFAPLAAFNRMVVKVLLKKKETPSKAFNVNLVKNLSITNSEFVNLGCADKTFNLPFTMSQSVAAFLNYPYEGGETNNNLKFIFINNTFKNCSCERAGALSVINYNYMTIRNCSFFNSEALEYGGALSVVSTNEFILENCTFNGATAGQGSFVYLQEVLIATVRDSIFANGRSLSMGGFICKRVNLLLFTKNTVENSTSEGNSAFFHLEETLLDMKSSTMSFLKAEKNGGSIYGSFGVDISISDFVLSQTKVLSGGLLFLQESNNLYLNNISVVNCTSSAFSTVIHVASYAIFRASVLNISGAYTKNKGTVFLSSIKENAITFITKLLCENSRATQGVCIQYRSSSDLILQESVIRNCSGESMIDIVSVALVKIQVEQLSICLSFFKNAFNSYLNELSLFQVNLSENQVTGASFQFSECKFRLTLITVDNYTVIKSDLAANENYILIASSSSGYMENIVISGSSLNFLKKYTQRSLLFLADNSDIVVTQMNASFIGDSLYEKYLIELHDSSFKFYNSKVSFTLGGSMLLMGSSIFVKKFQLFENSFQRGSFLKYEPYQEEISSLMLFEDCIFYALFGLRIFEIKMLSQLFLFNTTMKNTEGTFSGALFLQEVHKISIIFSEFYNFFTESEGAVLRVITKLASLQLKRIFLNDSSFYNNAASQGGAIYITLDDVTSLTITNCLFFNNTAKIKDVIQSTSGRGGSVVLICRVTEADGCQISANNLTFRINYAGKYCPTIFAVTAVKNEGIKFYNNSQAQGSEMNSFSSGPSCLAFSYVNKAPKCDLDTSYIEFTSGQLFNLSLVILDREGNKMEFDNYSLADLFYAENNQQTRQVLMDKYTSFASKGELEFINILIKTNPGWEFNINVRVSQRIDLTSSDPFDSSLIREEFLTRTIESKVKVISKLCQIGCIKAVDLSCNPCGQGSFSLIDPMNSEYENETQSCKPCPENAECNGKDNITPFPGYWRMSSNSSLIIRCPLEDACLGNSIQDLSVEQVISGACAKGHYGNLCFDCEDGFGKFNTGELCQACEVELGLVLLRTVILVLAVLAFIIINVNLFSRFVEGNKRNSFLSSISKILLNHFHQISIVTFMENLWIFPVLNDFLNFQNIFSFLNQNILSLECLLKSIDFDKRNTYIYKVVSSLLLPLIFSLISTVIWIMLLVSLIFLKKAHIKVVEAIIKKILMGFTVSIYIFYPLIIQSCFSLLNCITLENYSGETTFLYFAPNLECWTMNHKKFVVGLIVPGLFIFAVIFPIFLLKILKASHTYQRQSTISTVSEAAKNERRKKNFASHILKLMIEEGIFRFFYVGFREKYYYWEMIVFFKKFTLTMFSSLNQIFNSQSKNVLVLIFIFLNISLNLRCTPYKEVTINTIELISLTVPFFTAVCLILMGSIEDREGKKALAAAVFVLNLILILLVAKEIFINLFNRCKRRVAPKHPSE